MITTEDVIRAFFNGRRKEGEEMLDFKTSSDLQSAGYKLHHTATHPCYHTRKHTTCEPYSGKFGTGFKIHKAHPTSTQYHIVEYWIKEGK